MQRNLYIDCVKGIACIGVLFIHTVFWSGVSYVPAFLRSLSLLIDVPIFFFLSGLTSSLNIKKNLKRLLKLQLSYMFFISMIFLIQALYQKELDFMKLLLWFIHDYSGSDPLVVVMGSMWYLKVYILVIIIGLLLLKYIPEKYHLYLSIILFLFICFFTWYFRYEVGILVYIVFYLLIFTIGYQCKNIKFKKLYLFLILAFLFFSFLFLWILGVNLKLGNESKFPPNIVYFLYSLVSLSIILFFKDRVIISKNNLLTYIGQNAIFYYFSQGISSSIIFLLVGVLMNKLPWIILLPIMFLINLILAIFLAEIIKRLDKLFFKLF